MEKIEELKKLIDEKCKEILESNPAIRELDVEYNTQQGKTMVKVIIC